MCSFVRSFFKFNENISAAFYSESNIKISIAYILNSGFPLAFGGNDNNKLEMYDFKRNLWIEEESLDYPGGTVWVKIRG